MKPTDLVRKTEHDLDYQDRTTIFFSKMYRKKYNGVQQENKFKTTEGLMRIHQIKLYSRLNPGSKAKDKRVEETVFHITNEVTDRQLKVEKGYFKSVLAEGLVGGNSVQFICSKPGYSLGSRFGKYFELDLSDFSKDDFGGRGSTSGRVNFGNEYEEQLAATYYELSMAHNWEKLAWAKHVAVMDEGFSKITGGLSCSYCHWAGPQNTSRPLKEVNNAVAISSGGKVDGDIAEAVQDIMVQYGGDATKYPSSNAKGSKTAKPDPSAPYTFYISVKYGKTLAFFNCGVQGKGSKEATAFFPHDKMKNGEIAPAGKTLLDMFNIEEKPFIDIFKNYGKGGSGLSPYKFDTTLTTNQKTALEKMIYTGVGHGYYMAHFISGRFEFYKVDENYCKQASTLSGSTVELQYGGGDGKSKRINMIFSTNKYDFTFNIRNKQGAVYPSHTNGDYVLNVSAPKNI